MVFIACYCIHCPALTSVGEKRWTVRGITELFGLVLFRHGARTLSKSFIGAIALYVLTSLEFQVQLFCWRFVVEKIHENASIHLSNASKNHKKTRIGLVCAVHHMESWLVGARTTLQRCVWSTSHTVIAYPKHTKVQCKWKWSRSGMLVAKISGRGVLTTARAKGSLKQPLLADIYVRPSKLVTCLNDDGCFEGVPSLRTVLTTFRHNCHPWKVWINPCFESCTYAFSGNMESVSKEIQAFKHEPRRVKWKWWLLWVKIRIIRTKIQQETLKCTLWSSLGPGHYCCATKHDCTGLQFDPAFQCSCAIG